MLTVNIILLRAAMPLLLLALLLAMPALAQTTITLNAEDDWAPYSYVERGKEGIQGLAPKIITAAFATQQIKVNYRAVPFSRCLRETEEGQALGCFDIEINSDNAKRFYFHRTPLFQEGLSIFARAPHRTGLSAADLPGHAVGATNGYTYPPVIMQDSRIRKDISPSDEVQLRKLLAGGRIDYALINTTPAKLLFKKNPAFKGALLEVGLVNQASFYIGFSKKHPDGQKLAELFEEGLRTIKANGEYERLMREFRASLQ
ncbi:substrate-binding periplasmic protein [Chitinibacter tainanensis]|uniref:substrate-binding periplasmic protein n=1 Tax=Chitinibacter tainanensis TaxID=230667 RepID=UPI00042667DD|nr:transporter substrate-binding domain-containing protein [Chitinibacter tainanensis]